MWRDTTIAFSNKWKSHFISLEREHLLEPHLNRHIWLLHSLFLHRINDDAQTWAEHWNNHKIALLGRRASPLQMWMESQLLNGARGLEHLAADDPRITAPLTTVQNMGLNKEMLGRLRARERVHIEAPDSGTDVLKVLRVRQ